MWKDEQPAPNFRQQKRRRETLIIGAVSGIAILLLLMILEGLTAERINGRVVNVADGDTLTLLVGGAEQRRIRLGEIDAPEISHHSGQPGQPYGSRSKENLERICKGRDAWVDVQATDRYGRIVGRVYCDGIDANAEQVRTGMAWVYDQYVQDKSLYKLQDEARRSGKGIWADKAPIPPWQWRQQERRR